jgi:cell division protein FtsB
VVYTFSVFAKIQNLLAGGSSRFADVRNIGLYVFFLLVLAISWSTAKTVQSNYDLQKQISTIEQENEILRLYNENTTLQNKYYETDQYLELAARQNLGLAAPGEKVLLVPSSVSAKYVDKSLLPQSTQKNSTAQGENEGSYRQNLQAWYDFLLGRNLSQD